MFLLDTNVISELRKAKSGKSNKNVLRWAKEVSSSDMYLSAISVLELEIGILLVERRDPTQGTTLRSWLNEHVLPAFKERILSFDVAVAKCCAILHVPNPKSERDAIIAATALTHGLTLVTRNTDDFEFIDVEILNPWKITVDVEE